MSVRRSDASLLNLSGVALERIADVLLKNAGYPVCSERDLLRADARRAYILRTFMGDPVLMVTHGGHQLWEVVKK